MSKLRKYNFYYSDFGFISNGVVEAYELNENILVDDIYSVSITKKTPRRIGNFEFLFVFMFNDLVHNFYYLLLVVFVLFLIKKTIKTACFIEFNMSDGSVINLPIKSKLYRKAKVFTKRVLEYKLFLEINNLNN